MSARQRLRIPPGGFGLRRDGGIDERGGNGNRVFIECTILAFDRHYREWVRADRERGIVKILIDIGGGLKKRRKKFIAGEKAAGDV